MCNISKYHCVCYLLIFISLNGFADDGWAKKEAHMQCGTAFIQVSAECKVNPKDRMSNICKKYIINITENNKSRIYSLPYIPGGQRKLLEKQGYTFNKTIESGDWAPQTMSCYDGENIVINYTTGINDEETIKGSLTSNTSAPFFNLKGKFISGKKEKKLRFREIRKGTNFTYINFVGS